MTARSGMTLGTSAPARRALLNALKTLQHAHGRVLQARTATDREQARQERQQVRDRILAMFDATVADETA